MFFIVVKSALRTFLVYSHVCLVPQACRKAVAYQPAHTHSHTFIPVQSRRGADGREERGSVRVGTVQSDIPGYICGKSENGRGSDTKI